MWSCGPLLLTGFWAHVAPYNFKQAIQGHIESDERSGLKHTKTADDDNVSFEVVNSVHYICIFFTLFCLYALSRQSRLVAKMNMIFMFYLQRGPFQL